MSNSQVGFFAVYDNGRGINVISVALVNNIYRKYLTVGKREPVTIEIIRKNTVFPIGDNINAKSKLNISVVCAESDEASSAILSSSYRSPEQPHKESADTAQSIDMISFETLDFFIIKSQIACKFKKLLKSSRKNIFSCFKKCLFCYR